MPLRLSITDEQIVDWLTSGLMEVRNTDSPDPELWFRGRKRKAERSIQRGRYRIRESGDRMSFRVEWKGNRRRIVRAKLVWMAQHLRTVPEGCVIHHEDENRFNDCIGNLECKTEAEHLGIHYNQEY